MHFGLLTNSDGTGRFTNPLGDYGSGGSDYDGTETHYASPTGTSSWAAAAVSSLTPCSVETAFQNAVAGNRVKILPGTLDCAGTDFNEPYLRPSNNGTSGNEIVFFAENPASRNRGAGNTVLTQFRNTTNIGAIFGAHTPSTGIHHVILDGIDFPEYQNSEADGSYQVVLFSCSNVTLSKCTFNGESQATGAQNHGFVFSDGSSYVTMEDCYFENNSGSGENAAAVMFYGTTYTAIRYCTFDNNETGLFIKGEGVHGKNGNLTIEKNLFMNHSYTAIAIGGHQETTPDSGARSYIQQNIFYNNTKGVSGIQYGSYHSYVSINNNTVYLTTGTVGGNADCFYYFSTNVTSGNVGNEIKNNLFSDIGGAWLAEDNRTTAEVDITSFDIDGNYYFNEDYIFYGNPNVTSLSTWQSTYNHDDTAGTQGSNPNFQSTTVGNANFLKLNAGSPALTASTTNGPVGAYITGSEQIGMRAA
ncbi:MAG: right-handed parallel beta-helix repeat-containing protein [Candidatus Thiodiazotropha sp.]